MPNVALETGQAQRWHHLSTEVSEILGSHPEIGLT
jgi:hypothetical protein